MQTWEGLLRDGFHALGLGHDDTVMGSFRLYMAELLKWSKAYNLTSITEPVEIASKHFLDSALYIEAIPSGAGGAADVGSGAGFPGLVVGILRPELGMTLIEPTGKRTLFLENVIRRLGLSSVRVIKARAEDLKGLQVDAVMGRAVCTASEFVRISRGIIKPDGVFILSKGPGADSELEALEYSFDVEVRTIPGTGIERRMVTIYNGQTRER